MCAREVVFEILDSHLDVVLSVHRGDGPAARLTLGTLVFRHNLLEWLYMPPVAPMHRLIVRAALARGSRTVSPA